MRLKWLAMPTAAAILIIPAIATAVPVYRYEVTLTAPSGYTAVFRQRIPYLITPATAPGSPWSDASYRFEHFRYNYGDTCSSTVGTCRWATFISGSKNSTSNDGIPLNNYDQFIIGGEGWRADLAFALGSIFQPGTYQSLAGSSDWGVGTMVISLSESVPEPSTWALMILGFGAVGGALRTRRETRVATRKPTAT